MIAKNGIRAFSVIIVLLLALPVSADLEPLNNQKLKNLLNRNVTIVDVRRAEEWRDTGIVENSHLMTFFDSSGRFDAPAWLAQLAGVTSPDAPLILICHSGVRSKIIGDWLIAKQGFTQVFTVTDGIVSWKQNGNPVVAITE